jgi:hypothetical protein
VAVSEVLVFGVWFALDWVDAVVEGADVWIGIDTAEALRPPGDS